MKQQSKVYETTLNAAGIDACSEQVRAFLSEIALPRREIMRYAMAAEDILLKTMDECGEGAPVYLKTGTRFFRPYISLEIEGKADNVYARNKTEQSILGDGILKNLGISPDYSYTGDANLYYFRLRTRSVNPFMSLLIALAAAAGVGALGFFLPDGTRTAVLDGVLSPLHNVFLNALGCIAGPMVFLSVAWGIYGIGDAAALKQIGKKMLVGYIGTVYVIIVVLGWICTPLFSLDFSAGAGGVSELSSVFSMILEIVPKNIFSPFTDGNTLQIIFLAIVIGITLLFLGQKTNAVAKAVEQINYIVQFLIEFISKLVPYFIFIVLVKMIWSDTMSVLLGVGKLFAVFIAAVLIMVVCMVGYTSLRHRVRPSLLVKKGLPTLLIAITTASSAAAFGTNMTTCRKELGISDTIASFGIPLGIVAFKPTTALGYVVMALFFSEMYGVGASVSWLIMMMFTVGILALSTPPIPGGALTAYTVLFTQLGIPVEALAVALACDALFDFIDTGCDQFLLQFSLLNQAGKLGMVDTGILRSRKRKGSETIS